MRLRLAVLTRSSMRKRLVCLALALVSSTAVADPVLLLDINRTVSPVYQAPPLYPVPLRNGWLLNMCAGSICNPWFTDGTQQGTHQISQHANFSVKQFFVFGNFGYYAADGALYKTDGTAAGTGVFLPQPAWADVMAIANGYLFFYTAGSGLWRTDGTTAGTLKLLDMPEHSTLVSIGAQVLFTHDGGQGTELWSSDGTVAGTSMVREIAAGPDSSAPSGLARVGNRAFFWARTSNAAAPTLWVSDGTSLGTVQASSSTASTPIAEFQGKAYFLEYTGAGAEVVLKSSDGTPQGTVGVATFAYGASTLFPPFAAGNYLYFFAVEYGDGYAKLWRTDGTSAGTLRATAPGLGVSPYTAVFIGDRVFFQATDNALWSTRGDPASAVQVSTQLTAFGSMGRKLLVHGGITWLLDIDTETRTPLLSADGEPSAGSQCARTGPLPSVNGIILFAANDGLHGCELWRTDGTPDGTFLLADMGAGEAAGVDADVKMTIAGRYAYFLSGNRIWRTDGTTAGTTMVADGNSGTWDFVGLGDDLYMLSSISGNLELSRTRTRFAERTVLANFPTSTYAQFQMKLSATSAAVYFALQHGGNYQIFRYHAPTASLSSLGAIPPSLCSGLSSKTSLHSIFIADCFDVAKLWVAGDSAASLATVAFPTAGYSPDVRLLGTAGERALVRLPAINNRFKLVAVDAVTLAATEIPTSSGDWAILDSAAASTGAKLFLRGGGDPFPQGSLYVTDGTAGGTSPLASLDAFENPVTFGTSVFFMGTARGMGRSLWRSDGTVNGTSAMEPSVLYGSPNIENPLGVGPAGVVVSGYGNIEEAEPRIARFDATPDPLAFSSASPVPPSQYVVSSPALVSGTDLGALFTATNGQVCASSGARCTCDVSAFASTAVAMNGQYVCVRHVSASAPLTQVTTTLSADGTTTTFSSTTGPPVSLSVAVTGNAHGRITSSPSGIDCGAGCQATFASGAGVTLTAVPAANSRFAGWVGGGCTGISRCTLLLASATSVTAKFIAAARDLDSDGHADLLWHHSSAGDGAWLMGSTGPTSGGAIVAPAAGATIRLSADFDGDGHSDLLWRTPQGAYYVTLMNGLAVTATAKLLDGGSGWEVAEGADLDGDGKIDLIWHHTSGIYAAWLMDGTTVVGGGGLAQPTATAQLSNVADFDGDGKADFLWARADGGYDITLMDGVSAKFSQSILPGGTGWSVAGSGDFNGDGKADLLWKHTDGSFGLWLIDGTAVPPASMVTNGATWVGFPAGWNIVGTADLDGDGQSDILWAHTNGTVSAWLMSGVTPTAAANLMGASSGWSLVATDDFNGDGKADILWRHTTGQYAIWLMDGLAPIAGAVVLGGGTGWEVAP